MAFRERQCVVRLDYDDNNNQQHPSRGGYYNHPKQLLAVAFRERQCVVRLDYDGFIDATC